jgi:hypothetical protein
MLDQFEMRTEDMPTNMQALLRTYPRDTWDAHPVLRKRHAIGWAHTACSDN